MLEYTGVFMRIIGLDRYAPLETALEGAGFKVEEVEKQGKKTVITVSREEPSRPKTRSRGRASFERARYDQIDKILQTCTMGSL
jgi:hypothetical protein